MSDGEVDVASGSRTPLVVPVDADAPDVVGRPVDVLPEGPETVEVLGELSLTEGDVELDDAGNGAEVSSGCTVLLGEAVRVKVLNTDVDIFEIEGLAVRVNVLYTDVGIDETPLGPDGWLV